MEYWFCVYHAKLSLDAVWKMTVADRRWWINQTIEFLEEQKRAEEAASKGKKYSPDRKRDEESSARDLINKYKQKSSSEHDQA